jgi:hypothetical protein
LAPSLGQFIISMICKFPEEVKPHCAQIGTIIKHLLSSEMRQEALALQISSALFERIGIFDETFLRELFTQIFTVMHFYRNNTKNKVIPITITKAIHIFFATYMINQGCDKLVQACDNIQPGILFMILKSEGDKIKFCTSPARDRKYVIVAYTHLALEF